MHPEVFFRRQNRSFDASACLFQASATVFELKGHTWNQVLLSVQKGKRGNICFAGCALSGYSRRKFAWRRPVSLRCVSAPVASFENEKELFNFDALTAMLVCKSNLTLRGEACLIYCAQNRFGLPVYIQLRCRKKRGKSGLIFCEFSLPERKT
jgi:hypothetical protein